MAFKSPADKKTMLQIKVNNNQLKKDLKALTKIEEIDARYQHVKESQFRNKYEKYLTTGNFETSLIKNDAFKRATKETNVSTPNQGEHVPLHKLLYTNGAIDVDKVVCIHLLSVQYSKAICYEEDRTLRLFPKRSKPNVLGSSALPFYILEIDYKVNTESRTYLQDGQEVIIIVNSNLEKLITSILEVLAIVSPLKLKQIKELMSNKKSIQEIMIRTKILNFLAQVKESPVILNTENYRVEIAQYQEDPISDPNVLSVSRVRVKDKSRKIEQIQREIKNTINKYSERDVFGGESWSMLHKKYCSCEKAASRSSVTSGTAIALLKEDGTEFARVTGSGCRLPTGSSILRPSLTAIIKSSPRNPSSNIAEYSSGYSLNSPGTSFMKNQESRLINSMLHKVNNSRRILIGKKAAEYKSQHSSTEKSGKQKLPMNKIIQNVFSRDSLVSFASTTENEELKLLFQPCCKGGLGVGSILLESETSKAHKKECSKPSDPSCQFEDEVIPQMMKQEQSVMKTAQIKQEIFMSETRTKMKQFLQTDNPGENTSPRK